jgi:putative sterol carrier protein
MARSVQQIFQIAAQRGFNERLQRVTGSYRFDIEGDKSYRVEVDHGRITVRQDEGPADCVIGCTSDDFSRFADGEQNMLTAFMQGRVRIDGDLALAKMLYGILPGPKDQQPAAEGARP